MEKVAHAAQCDGFGGSDIGGDEDPVPAWVSGHQWLDRGALPAEEIGLVEVAPETQQSVRV